MKKQVTRKLTSPLRLREVAAADMNLVSPNLVGDCRKI